MRGFQFLIAASVMLPGQYANANQVTDCLGAKASEYAVALCDPAPSLVGAVMGACSDLIQAARRDAMNDPAYAAIPYEDRLRMVKTLYNDMGPAIENAIVEQRIATQSCRR